MDALLDRAFSTARSPARHYNRRMPTERALPKDLADRTDALCRAWSDDPDLAAIS
jgi:hypothetical protein